MHDAIWSAIFAEPDKPQPWLVLGDALEAAGDPRGQLIGIQLARETNHGRDLRNAERRHIFEHGDALLGPLFRRAEPWRVTWQRGFFETLELTVDGYTKQCAQVLSKLASDGALRPLRHLRLVSTANFDAAARAILNHRWPLLESLRIGPLTLGAGRVDVPLQELLDVLPALKMLRVQFPASVAGLRHARLECLEVAGYAEQLGAFSIAGLPALRRVEMFSRDLMARTAFEGLRARGLEELSLHPTVAAGWLASRPAAPRRLVLWDRDADCWERGRALGCEVIAATRLDANRDPLLTPESQLGLRRFHKEQRFWQIRREGALLRYRYGKVGKNGRAREKAHRSPYEASGDYCKRLGAKLEQGFVEVFVP